ncbi:MAG: hypothetical protein SVX28_11840 [Pseudomonadota bacterium]|nr:hypothetical protein [Pseudomonadota bacterium]
MNTPVTPVWQHYASAIASGFLGDWLEQRCNPLAVSMSLIEHGQPLDPARPEPANIGSVIYLSIHGLMELESVFTFPGTPGEHYGSMLAEQLDQPVTSLSLRYNTGRPIYRNGEDLAGILETLVASWPVAVEKVVLLGHSMGGLLIRSACHYGELQGHKWLSSLDACIYAGSPHDGSWLARGAKSLAGMTRKMPRDYLRVVGEVIDIRSEGIRNLSRGDILAEQGKDAPLVPGVRHFVVCGLLGRSRGNPLNALFGDALVHESSARGRDRGGWSLAGMATFPGIDHIRLAHHPDVGRQLVEWLV